jgi:hypothetical protein
MCSRTFCILVSTATDCTVRAANQAFYQNPYPWLAELHAVLSCPLCCSMGDMRELANFSPTEMFVSFHCCQQLHSIRGCAFEPCLRLQRAMAQQTC